MNTDQQIAKYVTELQPMYRLFATKVEELIRSILEANGIVPHSVTSREKTATGLEEKIARGGKTYEHPLEQITDLAGVRIITYFPTDVDRILPMLKQEFTIDEKHSVDSRQTTDPSAFGYASVHLVVGLAPERVKLPEYSMFKSLRCEIQVRTILQHAWAEIEHDIVYKSSDQIPFELRRKFASLAGLLEVADREFEMLRHQETEVRKRIEKTIKDDRLDLPVNLDSVSLYLQRYHKEKNILQTQVGNLVRVLSEHGIATVQQLHDMLGKHSLEEAKKKEDQVSGRCSQAQRCLLMYFLAVGKRLGLSERDIGEAAHCPALIEGKEYRGRGRLRISSSESRRERSGRKAEQADGSHK